MAFTLRSQKDSSLILNLTQQAWFGILDLADLYGWTPIGAILPGDWQDIDIPLYGYDFDFLPDSAGYHPIDDSRLVILEDALNLADALEQAFFEYEPLRVPASYYLFEPDDEYLRLRPSIGAITSVIELCRAGAFWIEPYRRRY